MPTKPAESITIWSSNAVHLFGDYPGSDTKVSPGAGVIAAGLIPGDPAPPTAEELNYTWSLWTTWLEWVENGTSDSISSASIVERTSTGQINAERLVILNTQNQTGIDSTGDNGNTGVIGRSTRTGVHGLGSGAFPAVLGACSSSGPGVQGTSSTGYGGRFTGGGSLPGVRADGSNTASAGLTANGTGGEPDIFLDPASNYGIDIQCAASALGGIRILSNGQLGLYIAQDDPAYGAAEFYGDSAQASAVPVLYSRAFNAGDAIHTVANTGTGYCLRMTPKSAAPTRGSIFNAGQAARPSDITDGQLTRLSTENQWAVSCSQDFGAGAGAGWRGILTTIGGSAHGYAFSTSILSSGAIGAWVDSVLIAASGGDAPKVGTRQVIMRISVTCRGAGAHLPSRLNLQLLDVTAGGGVVWTRSGGNGFAIRDPGPLPLEGWESIFVQVPITVPLAGDRVWRLQFGTALNSLVIKDVCVAFGPGMV